MAYRSKLTAMTEFCDCGVPRSSDDADEVLVPLPVVTATSPVSTPHRQESYTKGSLGVNPESYPSGSSPRPRHDVRH